MRLLNTSVPGNRKEWKALGDNFIHRRPMPSWRHTAVPTNWELEVVLAFQTFLVYILNIYRATEPCFLLLIGVLERSTLPSRNRKHISLVLADGRLCFCRRNTNRSQNKPAWDKDWTKWQLKAWQPSQSTHYQLFFWRILVKSVKDLNLAVA